jgi:REP-associated tyrosine transposase
MTRPLRIEVADGIHHAMSRGINKQPTFHSRLDYDAFLRELQSSVIRCGWRCIAYCLMGNHFHLLVQTPRANLAPGMRDLKSAYATGFNGRHGRRGPLFESRYKSQLVQDRDYLIAAARYIALNPVRAGLTLRPEDYPWSSFRDFEAGTPSRLMDPRPLLSSISADREVARQTFLELVADGSGLPAYDPRPPIFGDAEFVKQHAPDDPPEQPVARAVWDQARPAIAELVERLSEDDAMREARCTHRYTIREIAAAFACSAETVRRRLKMWDVRT